MPSFKEVKPIHIESEDKEGYEGKKEVVSKKKSLDILKVNSPLLMQEIISYTMEHFKSEDRVRRGEAHKFALKFIDKMVPNKVEEDKKVKGMVDSNLAKQLLELARSKGQEIKTMHDVEEAKIVDADSTR